MPRLVLSLTQGFTGAPKALTIGLIELNFGTFCLGFMRDMYRKRDHPANVF